MTTLPIRTMSVGEILAHAFDLFRRNLILLVLVAFLPQVVLLVIEYLFSALVSGPSPVLLLILAAVVALNAIALSAITIAVAGAALGFPPTVGQTYDVTFRNHLLWVVTAYVMTTMMVAVGFSLVFAPSLVLGLVPAILLAFVPTLVLGGFLALTIPVIVLESLPPMMAVRRSISLMREELKKGIAIFAFVVLISGVLPLGLQLIVGVGPLTPLLAAVVGSVTLPLAYTANVLLYFTVRAREGYTAEQLQSDLTSRVSR